jgi:NAD(P)-dependent dehydrogenase (short-subunit alcohol dehydrogenase family)
VVTGAGRGIGAAIARHLADNGASVVVSARTTAEIEAVAAELAGSARALACDVSVPEQVERLAEAANQHLGRVDILINNAGFAKSAPLSSLEVGDWNRMMAVNATGTFLCTKAFLPQMIERGWGRVVNVASTAGKVGTAYISAYAASKHAVLGFTRSIAMEVATAGVTVNAVCPGYVDTQLVEHAVDRIVRTTGSDAQRVRRQLAAASPQKRIFAASEVAYVVASLCDVRAGGINGQAIVIDGGMVQS